MYTLASYVVQPLLPLCFLAAGMLIFLWRKNLTRRGRLLWTIVALAVLSGLCTPAAAYWALGSLEWRYPPEPNRPNGVEAIVVLAGGTIPPDSVLPNGEMCASTLHRCIHGARLYRQGPPCLVVATGDPKGTRLMRDFLVEQGVAKSDLLVESCSYTTYENAAATRKLLHERGIDRIVLVTDAAHLPRASRCFSAQGFEVTPSGCHYRATSINAPFFGLLPSPGGARDMQDAMHEWMGLGWYWLRGRI
jgi:uncharacterized SAM-binding protein YcdF (DUF218 family)